MEDSDSVELVDMSRVTLFDIIYDMNRLQFAQELIKPPSNAGRSQKYNIISSRLCDNIVCLSPPSNSTSIEMRGSIKPTTSFCASTSKTRFCLRERNLECAVEVVKNSVLPRTYVQVNDRLR